MSQQQGQQVVKEGPKAQGQQDDELRTRTWINKKLIGFYKEGFLELRNGRVSFTKRGNEKVFDSPLGEVQAEFPKYMWGGGAKLTVRGQRYYIGFSRPGSRSVVGGIASIMAYRRWREVLTSSEHGAGPLQAGAPRQVRFRGAAKAMRLRQGRRRKRGAHCLRNNESL